MLKSDPVYFFILISSTLYLPGTSSRLNSLSSFIHLSLAVLGLRCCTQAFSSCSEQRLLLVVVLRLLTAVASLVADHGL